MWPQVLGRNAGGLSDPTKGEAVVEPDEDVPEVDEKRPRPGFGAQRTALATAAGAPDARTGSPGMR
jgi:hypothetical protein